MPSRTDGGPEISARPAARGARAAGAVVSIKAATRGADPAAAGIGAAEAGTAGASVAAAAAFGVWGAGDNPGAAGGSVAAERGAAGDSAGSSLCRRSVNVVGRRSSVMATATQSKAASFPHPLLGELG